MNLYQSLISFILCIILLTKRMSKQSKIPRFQENFQICFVRKHQSQSVFPNSADKGKSFNEGQDVSKKSKKIKFKRQQQFYLTHRQKKRSSDLLSFYRMKSLKFPVTHLKAEDIKGFMILGTYDNKIIVGFNKNLKLFCFFDQHATHQRIRYEYYLDYLETYGDQNKSMKEWNSDIIQKSGKKSELISGVKHSYTSYQVIRTLDSQIQEDTFVSKFGFEVQYVKKEMTLKILKVPLILERALDSKLVLNIAHDIILDKNKLPKCLQSIIAEISCKSAYKFNDKLELPLIKQLISNLSICQYPFFCVHGRPTLFTRI